ncbi:hypothetical protein J4218_01730 [Candidatus Pacearchaeota archaeon]|nr:hypothetical protein [uncultured archaeon]MBS3078818.1 hypothetical protein [Candidatus Pacearchaeota archaeon]
MVTHILEEEDFEIHDGLKFCKIRAYLLREVPGHEDEKLLKQSHCYSKCNSTCPKNPYYGLYV